MRLLFLFLCSLAVALAQTQVTKETKETNKVKVSTSEEELDLHKEKSITEIYESVINMEREIAEQWKSDYNKVKQARADMKAEISDRLKQSYLDLEYTIKDKFDSLESQIAEAEAIQNRVINKETAAVDAFKEKTKEAFEQVIQKVEKVEVEKTEQREAFKEEMKQAYDEYKAAREQKKQEEKEKWNTIVEKVKQKISEVRTSMQEAEAAKEQKKQESLNKLKAKLDSLKETIQQEVERREAARLQREQERENKLKEYKDRIAAAKAEYDAQQAELVDKYNVVEEKRNAYLQAVKEAFIENMKIRMGENADETIQTELDKEAIREVVRQKLGLNPDGSEDAKLPVAVAAAPKTLLDDVTGKSQWQAVTWILLALSILLAIGLIVMVGHQIHLRNKYRADNNAGHFHERTPIVQTRTAGPPGYDKQVVPYEEHQIV